MECFWKEPQLFFTAVFTFSCSIGHLLVFLLTLQMWGKWIGCEWFTKDIFQNDFNNFFDFRLQDMIDNNRLHSRTLFRKTMLNAPILLLVSINLSISSIFAYSHGLLTLLLNPARFWSLIIALYLWWKAKGLVAKDFTWVCYLISFLLSRTWFLIFLFYYRNFVNPSN